jgi:5'-phosphate synthase pdxT subunit
MTTVGVLALQGGFAAHVAAVERAGMRAVEVRAPREIMGLDGLVLPGGESTVMLKMIGRGELGPALDAFVSSGAPVLATCAGLILAARRVTGPVQPSFGWLDVDVARNAWGRQLDSFEGTSDRGTPLVFIRAPRIMRVGPEVEVVETLSGEPVMVRDGNVWGATFHPELSEGAGAHAMIFSRNSAVPRPIATAIGSDGGGRRSPRV